MSTTTANRAETTAIRPFTVPAIPEAELDALRARIKATRWPDPELVTDLSQGVQLAMIRNSRATGRRSTTGAGARRG